MMLGRILASDFLKLRRKLIWFLAFLGPIGVVSMQTLNFWLRYDYLSTRYASDWWSAWINNIHFLAIPVLLMGTAILASMLANIEHQMNAWKQTLALPVSKTAVFVSKWIVLAVVLTVSCTVMAVGAVLLGKALQFTDKVPYLTLLAKMYLPLAAALPFLSLQLWLSMLMKNQAIPLTIGILITVLSMYGAAMPVWFPLYWPYLGEVWNEQLVSAGSGIAAGLLLYLSGLVLLVRKDVS